MTNPFHQAVRGAHATLATLAGAPVVYRRGEDEVTVTAVVGESRFEVTDRNGMVTQVTARDYLVDVREIDFGAGWVEPEEGDEIEETDEGAGERLVYQVMGPGGSEPAWRWRDSERRQVRIHTKLIRRITT